jgi:P pilus assembly chaperone PapD
MKKAGLIFKAITCAALLLMPTQAAAVAKLQVYPTRVEIKDGETSGFVTVINGGSSTGRYRADFTDVEMPEQGVLKPVPEGQTAKYSAQPYLRISPRSVTVPPGQSQKFRILARVPRDLPDGEYLTHLNVMMSSNDVEAESAPTKGIAMKVQPRFRLSLPVMILKGATHVTTAIANLSIEQKQNTGGGNVAVVEFATQGNRSARGELTITFTQGNKSYELYRATGVGVYRDVPRRLHRAGLKVPEGLTLSGGVLKATFVGEDGEMLAEKAVNL